MAEPDSEPIFGEIDQLSLNCFATVLEMLLARRRATLWSLSPADVASREIAGKPRPIQLSPAIISRLKWSMKLGKVYPILKLEVLKLIADQYKFGRRERQELIAALLVTALQQRLVNLLPSLEPIKSLQLAQEMYPPLLAKVQEMGLNLLEKNAGGKMSDREVARYELYHALAAYDEAVMILNFLELPTLSGEILGEEMLPAWLPSSERLERLTQAQEACLHARNQLEFLGEPRDEEWQTWLAEVNQTLEQVDAAITTLRSSLHQRDTTET